MWVDCGFPISGTPLIAGPSPLGAGRREHDLDPAESSDPGSLEKLDVASRGRFAHGTRTRCLRMNQCQVVRSAIEDGKDGKDGKGGKDFRSRVGRHLRL